MHPSMLFDKYSWFYQLSVFAIFLTNVGLHQTYLKKCTHVETKSQEWIRTVCNILEKPQNSPHFRNNLYQWTFITISQSITILSSKSTKYSKTGHSCGFLYGFFFEMPNGLDYIVLCKYRSTAIWNASINELMWKIWYKKGINIKIKTKICIIVWIACIKAYHNRAKFLK